MKRSREPEDEANSPDASVRSGPDSPSLSPVRGDGLPRAKIAELDSPAETPIRPSAMICLLHKEKVCFDSYEEYDSHYNKCHLNRCLECGNNFPSSQFLNIHIEDCHDPLAALKRDKGEHTYACFVEDCERKCATPDKRRRHLIDKHMYPKNFFFAVTRYGIDGRRSLLEEGSYRQKRKSSISIKKEARRSLNLSETGNTMETGQKGKEEEAGGAVEPGTSRKGQDRAAVAGEAPPEAEMDDLVGAMSSLKFIPPSLRFGRGGRAGFARR